MHENVNSYFSFNGCIWIAIFQFVLLRSLLLVSESEPVNLQKNLNENRLKLVNRRYVDGSGGSARRMCFYVS